MAKVKDTAEAEVVDDASAASPLAEQPEQPEQSPDTPTVDEVVASHDDPSSTAPSLTHVVLRPFVGEGVERFIGEVVDASNWRMADVLVEGRRLRVFGRKDPEPLSDGQGRYFISDDALLAYIEATIEADVTPTSEET